MQHLNGGVEVLEAFDLSEHWYVASRKVEVDFSRAFSCQLRQFVISDSLEKCFGDVRGDKVPASEYSFAD